MGTWQPSSQVITICTSWTINWTDWMLKQLGLLGAHAVLLLQWYLPWPNVQLFVPSYDCRKLAWQTTNWLIFVTLHCNAYENMKFSSPALSSAHRHLSLLWVRKCLVQVIHFARRMSWALCWNLGWLIHCSIWSFTSWCRVWTWQVGHDIK